MYATRDLVREEIERFHSIHAGPRTSTMRHIQDGAFDRCDNECSCWAACTSSECRVAVYTLAAARNVSLPGMCVDSAMRGRLERIAYVKALMSASDEEVMTETVELTDAPTQPVTPESIVSLSWRGLLVANGMTALLELPKRLDLPESYAAHTQAAYRRVHLLSDVFYVKELLRRDDSLLGEFCHLLGRCEPCIVPRRPWRAGNSRGERIPRKRTHPSLAGRKSEHLVNVALHWVLKRDDGNSGPTTSDEPSNDEPTSDEPSDDEPINDEPSDDEPINDEPSDDEPISDEPSDSDEEMRLCRRF